MFGQKLKHVQYALKLTMLAVLPLYMSTIEKKKCSDNASRLDNFNVNGCPSDGSKDDDVITLEGMECAEDDPNDKVGNTSSVGRSPYAIMAMNQKSNLQLRRTATSSHPYCLNPK